MIWTRHSDAEPDIAFKGNIKEEIFLWLLWRKCNQCLYVPAASNLWRNLSVWQSWKCTMTFSGRQRIDRDNNGQSFPRSSSFFLPSILFLCLHDVPLSIRPPAPASTLFTKLTEAPTVIGPARGTSTLTLLINWISWPLLSVWRGYGEQGCFCFALPPCTHTHTQTHARKDSASAKKLFFSHNAAPNFVIIAKEDEANWVIPYLLPQN